MERQLCARISPHVRRTKCISRQACQAQGALPGRSDGRKKAEPSDRRQLFNRVAGTYDMMNDAFSAGLHRGWKAYAVAETGARGGTIALDVCTGSGDMAFLLADRVGSEGRVTAVDFSEELMEVGRMRDRRRPRGVRGSARIDWVLADAHQLPFSDNYFGAATIGFGLRNGADKRRMLCELARVLCPGSKAVVLDFNCAGNESHPISVVQKLALTRGVVPVAECLGVGAEYEYLWPSIRNFATGEEQERLALDCGFSCARHVPVGFGLMGVLAVSL